VLGALDIEGIVAHTSQEGAMTRADVERFFRGRCRAFLPGPMSSVSSGADVERFFRVDLLPRLLPGSVLVLDNASIHNIHKGGSIERLARRAGCAGCRVLYLPPYSPDLNPIELVWGIWGIVKRSVRREGPREASVRQACVESGLAAVTAELAQSCFRHCHYCL
jgi:transposase